MMKKFLLFNLLVCYLLLSGLSLAQTATVTITVQDSFNQVWANGSIGYSIYGSGTYIWNGAPLAGSYYSVTTLALDSSGHASFNLPMTSAITPIGSLWKIIACPNATANCVTAYIPINGSSVDISNAINSLIPVASIPIQTMPKAYNDAEIIATVSQGGIYYNTGNITPGLRYWTGNAFQPISSGGGSSGVTSINNNTGVFQFTGNVICSGSAPVTCNFSGSTGTVTSVTNSDGTVTITNPNTTPVLTLNLNHSNTWLAAQIFSDGSNNTVSLKNGADGIGTYFAASGGQTGEIQFNSSGLNFLSSPKAIYFSNDNTFAQGIVFSMNTSGTPSSVSIAPLDGSKYLSLASGTVGIYTAHIVFNGTQTTHLATDSSAPVDISNNSHGVKINLISAAVLGTDSTGKIIVGSGGGGGSFPDLTDTAGVSLVSTVPFTATTVGTTTATNGTLDLSYVSTNPPTVTGNTARITAAQNIPTPYTISLPTADASGQLYGADTSGTVQLSFVPRAWSCQPGFGDGVVAITSGTYPNFWCKNDTGSTVTVTGVTCHTDNAGTSTCNVASSTSSPLLTGAITGSNSSWVAGTLSGTPTIANGDYIVISYVSDGATKMIEAAVRGTY